MQRSRSQVNIDFVPQHASYHQLPSDILRERPIRTNYSSRFSRELIIIKCLPSASESPQLGVQIIATASCALTSFRNSTSRADSSKVRKADYITPWPRNTSSIQARRESITIHRHAVSSTQSTSSEMQRSLVHSLVSVTNMLGGQYSNIAMARGTHRASCIPGGSDGYEYRQRLLVVGEVKNFISCSMLWGPKGPFQPIY